MTTTEAPTLTAGTWTVDPAHSEIGFAVRHLGLSKVRGRFTTFSGTVTVAEDLASAAVAAEVDLASVDTNQPDRDNHLRSTDFFDVDTHPTMTLTATSTSTDELSGELTINGVTRPVRFDVEHHGVTVDGYGTTRAGFSASATINRSEFGIDFNMPAGLDGMLIADKVSVELEIQIVPQA